MAQANTVQPDDTTGNPHFRAISQFDAVMRAYNESGIRYAFRYYDDDDHGSVPLIAEHDALRFIFNGYRFPFQRVIAEPALLIEHFQHVSERLGQTFLPTERMVGFLARIMLQQDTTTAVTFGEMRVQLYPDSYRAYAFLGDVWAAKGEVDRARDYYQQALAKSPGASAVREKLTQLGR